ncbi:MAG: hypothetical protein E6J90_01115 [Deltaproteobacteria bacterium]|nr:MAG: hypothetical protein E6J91_06145 [Deltaproteobacteria bacterium]TMQ28027.1 MAG: hypothetical protein E6J90_01115 [Deltaproteobacteria bacterium]
MMHRRCALVVVLAGACSADPPPPPVDLCDSTVASKVVTAGSAQLGLGDDCAPVAEGQQVGLVCGTQGGTMFLVNARVQDLDITAQHQGAVDFTAIGPGGANLTAVSIGCRVRDFTMASDGTMQLRTAYGLQLDPEALQTLQLEGASIQITAKVRDHLGQQATDTRTIVAHLPPACAP